MSAPGSRAKGEDLAPLFSLRVEGALIKEDLSQYIQSVSFESAADMADMLTIVVNNPGFAFAGGEDDHPDLTAHKVFQPGNEMELRAGYGQADTFIGRAIIAKHLPSFPEDGVPTLTIKGYDKSFMMMDTSGPIQSAQGNKIDLKTPRPVNNQDDQGTPFVDMKASDVVAQVASKYGFALDIDPTDRTLKASKGDGIIQKKGMKDYDLVRILANLNQREFFVDYQTQAPTYIGSSGPGGKWVLHWLKSADTTQPQLLFKYGAGNESTLLSFDTEYGLRETISEVVVLAWDADQERWVSALILENVEGPDPRWRTGGGRMERSKPVTQEKLTTKNAYAEVTAKKASAASAKTKLKKSKEAATSNNEIRKTLKSATEFRLAAGGTAIDVRADRPFESLQDAAAYAARWFKERKDHFIVGKGELIGVETLRARQVHKLEGLGPRLSGDWYFINVEHKFEADGGYRCSFTARKVIT